MPNPTIRYADRAGWRTRAWRAAVTGSHVAARPSAPFRATPDYLIVGAQRAGTTSLHHYLTQSPAVVPARLTKGVHWFDVNADRSAGWYRAHFPLRATLAARGRRAGTDRAVTGEGSPYYLFHPAVPRRIAAELPTTKLLVVLRDPVQRAWSQYHHEVGKGFETLGFEDALDREEDRLAGEEERLLADPGYHSLSHQHHSYVARGHYAEQLERLFAAVGRDRVLVLESGDLRRARQQAVDHVADFLGIPRWTLTDDTTHNARRYDRMPGHLRDRLARHFAGPNERLFRLLGRRWDWTSVEEAAA